MAKANPENKQLFRSRANYILFGVCGGLGEYFGMDPMIVRIILVILILWAGSGLLLYLILALLIPRAAEKGKEASTTFDFKERIDGLVAEVKALGEKYSGK
jgi:phage shock protein C